MTERDYTPKSESLKRPRLEKNHVDSRFIIGTAGGRLYWTNEAINHANGRQPNHRLVAMTDEQLAALAFKDPKRQDGIRTEAYRRPLDRSEADAQGGEAGKEYHGVHRAWAILEFRAAHQIAMTQARMMENDGALASLAIGPAPVR